METTLLIVFGICAIICIWHFNEESYGMSLFFFLLCLISISFVFSNAEEDSFFYSIKKTQQERNEEAKRYYEARGAPRVIQEIEGCKVYSFIDDSRRNNKIVYFTKCSDGTASVK